MPAAILEAIVRVDGAAGAEAQLAGVGRSIDKLGANTGLSRLQSAGKLVFAAVGVAAVAGIGKAIDTTVKLAGETRSLARQFGITTESASGYRVAFETLGIGQEKAARAIAFFEKSLVNNTTKIQQYGLSLRDASGEVKPFEQLLGEAADKYVSLSSGAEKAAFAMNVFGKSGKDLMPLLAQGSAGIAKLAEEAEKLGLVFSEQDVQAARALQIAHRQLDESVQGLEVSIGQGFLPILTAGARGMTFMVQAVNMLPGPLKVGLVSTVALVGGLTALGIVVGVVKRGFGELGLLGTSATEAAAAVSTLGVAGAGTATELEVLSSIEAQLIAQNEALGISAGSAAAAESTVGVAGAGAAVETGALAEVLPLASGGVAALGVAAFVAAPFIIGIVSSLRAASVEAQLHRETMARLYKELLNTPGLYHKLAVSVREYDQAHPDAAKFAAFAHGIREEALSQDDLNVLWRAGTTTLKNFSAAATEANGQLLGSAKTAYDAAVAHRDLGEATRILIGWQTAGAAGWSQYNAVTKDATDITNDQRREIGLSIATLDELGSGLTKTQRKQLEAAVTTGDWSRAESILDGALKAVGGSLDEISGKIRSVAEAHAFAALEANAQRDAELALSGGLLGIAGAASQVTSAHRALIDAQAKVNKDIQDGKKGTREYKDDVLALGQAQLGAVITQLGLRQAVASYADTLFGPVHAAADQVAKDQEAIAAGGKDASAAQQRLAADEQALADAQAALGPEQAKAIEQIRKMGKEAGLTKPQIQALIDEITGYTDRVKGIPDAHNTDLKNDADPEKTRVQGYINKINAVPKSHTTDMIVNTGTALGRLASLQAALGNVKLHYGITIDVDYAIHGGFPTGQHGQPDWSGGVLMVGEAGRELVALPPHSRVIPHDQTEALLSDSGMRVQPLGSSLNKAGDIYNIYEAASPEQILGKIAFARATRPW